MSNSLYLLKANAKVKGQFPDFEGTFDGSLIFSDELKAQLFDVIDIDNLEQQLSEIISDVYSSGFNYASDMYVEIDQDDSEEATEARALQRLLALLGIKGEHE